MIAGTLIAFGYAYGLWVLFLAVMAFHYAWLTLPAFTRGRAVTTVAEAIVPLGEQPQEWIFSQRMERYKQWAVLHPGHWRVRLAQWVCANLLDTFQIGGSCRA